MRRLWQNWLAYLEARRRYHRDDAREIAVNNLRTLNKVTPLTFLLLAVFLLATPYILPGWRPSVWHLAFVPVSILLAACFTPSAVAISISTLLNLTFASSYFGTI